MTTQSTAPALLASLIENESAATGQSADEIEEHRNDARFDLESKLFSLPTSDVGVLAAKLHALWPDIADGKSYEDAPAPGDDLAIKRLWTLIHEAKKLAEGERKPSTTGLLDYYKSEVEKAGA